MKPRKSIWSRLFPKKFKTQLIDNKYRVIEAFEFDGIKYYQFDNQFEAPTGRQMAALAIYHEMEMVVDKEYLGKHCKAMEKLLSDPKKISIGAIAQINVNLQERLTLMPLPEFIYKLASVVYFDETESIYSYDYSYNEKKIERWKKSGDTLDFFLKTPIKELIPALNNTAQNIKMSFQVGNMIDKIHRENLSGILSEVQ